MPSHTSSANLSPLGFQRSPKRSLFSTLPRHRPRISFDSSFYIRELNSYFDPKLLLISGVRKYGCCSRRRILHVTAMDEDSVASYSLDDWVDNEEAFTGMYSSSEGEESDGEILLNPITDVDLPSVREKFRHNDDALTVTAHRLAMMGRARKKSRIKYGSFINMGLMTFLTLLLLLVDWCAWRIVRLPLSPFHLIRPFSTSAVLASCAGYIGVPLLRRLKMQAFIRKEGPARHSFKKGTPTMGGLFFIPIGIIVAEFIVGFSSIEVSGAAIATLAFAAIGLLDDSLSLINNNKNGLSAWMRILLEVVAGAWFCFWLVTTDISSPYSIKMVVPLPVPVGLVCLGNAYLFLTSFCFVSMANGINLTDGLDGLAGGTAALAFIGMSIAVLPVCSDLAVFGASMAGACVGFLSHNRYKASVFMGDTGSLALGGALAAMAACTGMFFPLFISSGIFVLEALSVIMQILLSKKNAQPVTHQCTCTWYDYPVDAKYNPSILPVSFFKATKYIGGRGHRLFRMAPFHHHLELCGVKEPIIVAGAYIISSILILCAGYVALISV